MLDCSRLCISEDGPPSSWTESLRFKIMGEGFLSLEQNHEFIVQFYLITNNMLPWSTEWSRTECCSLSGFKLYFQTGWLEELLFSSLPVLLAWFSSSQQRFAGLGTASAYFTCCFIRRWACCLQELFKLLLYEGAILGPPDNLNYSSDHYLDYLCLAALVWCCQVAGHTEFLLVGMCVYEDVKSRLV